MRTLNLIFDWSEVWALLVPMIFILRTRNREFYLRPIIFYVFAAFVINLIADIIADFKKPFNFPSFLQTNTFLYNIHSILRFACFSQFFIRLSPPFYTTAKKVIQIVGLVFSIVYFSYENFNNPNHISGDFLATEAFLLLIFCMLYFLHKLRIENYKPFHSSEFYIVMGLSIFVVINFFVFLFYIPMIDEDAALANNMWDVHNLVYIVLCLCIARAFYKPYPLNATA